MDVEKAADDDDESVEDDGEDVDDTGAEKQLLPAKPKNPKTQSAPTSVRSKPQEPPALSNVPVQSNARMTTRATTAVAALVPEANVSKLSDAIGEKLTTSGDYHKILETPIFVCLFVFKHTMFALQGAGRFLRYAKPCASYPATIKRNKSTYISQITTERRFLTIGTIWRMLLRTRCVTYQI